MMIYVIVPVYNVEKYLAKCLDSIFNQTYKDFVVIAVNDGSTDNSLRVLIDYSSKYSNLKIINKKNGGLSSARNAGLNCIENFNDALILYVDSDDYISNNYFEMMVNEQLSSNADIVLASYCDSYEDGHIDQPHFLFDKDTCLDIYDATELLFSGSIQSHSPCKLYKGWLWQYFRFDENIKFMEDQQATFQLFLKSNKISYIHYSGYYYLHRIGSLCQSFMSNEKILSALSSYTFCYNYNFSNINEELVKKYKTLIIQSYANIFLMMYPRFSKKNATIIEFEKWNSFLKFNKRTKAIFKFKPRNLKEFIKKYTFIFIPFFYKILYKSFLKNYD